MNNMNETIIDRIKKLFSLAESDNVNEASISLAKAQSMLTKYNIDRSKIFNSDEDEIIDSPYMENKKIRQWKISLLIAIAKVNYCTAYRNIALTENDKIETVLLNIIGKKYNVEATKIMADYIFNAINNKVQSTMLNTGKMSIEAFKVGYAATIITRLAMIKAVENKDQDCKELVIVEDKKISDYMNNMKLKNSIIDTSIVDVNSYVVGRKAGYELSLNKQIGNEEKNLIE